MIQDCNSSGGDLGLCSYKKSCTDACEVKELVEACANSQGNLSKCTRAAVDEQTCKSKCELQDIQSINACIANKATDFSVCSAQTSKDYLLLGTPPKTQCVKVATNTGRYTRQDCIAMGYVV